MMIMMAANMLMETFDHPNEGSRRSTSIRSRSTYLTGKWSMGYLAYDNALQTRSVTLSCFPRRGVNRSVCLASYLNQSLSKREGVNADSYSAPSIPPTCASSIHRHQSNIITPIRRRWGSGGGGGGGGHGTTKMAASGLSGRVIWKDPYIAAPVFFPLPFPTDGRKSKISVEPRPRGCVILSPSCDTVHILSLV